VHFSFVTPESLPDDPTGRISRRERGGGAVLPGDPDLGAQDVPPQSAPLAGDGPIGRSRKWARQFYEDAVDDSDAVVHVP